ncbi:hypothetical protein GUITHDRAFT_143229 [Guillardia theta CCMP2712]|uniref:Uncharacterized protein n=1 Tax=Guillardia theta (strain CCMP2712) TaxID=905079 RepID=L1IVJ4_GUITC|nr:hypothetical protein GUITHDRAFT_143229 [Guillardia theta CCMP2712]EKX39850.1 hypothetical protein GUITHDRAFT_143229 [Guillardia theta CCMP2712]|eukprot:XP_005826830.1 hypothetical protein GUITHDRAFT_143229 [Guillardia theta CCMP2712]
MQEIEELGWMLPGGYMDVPANRNKELVHVLGSYIDNVVGSRRRMYAWSVPCEEALRSIAQASPNGILELGAGTGYWASLLRSRGVPVVCYDRVPVSGAVRFGERQEGGQTIPDAHVHTCSHNSVEGHAKINSQHALRSSICLQDFDCHFTATAAPFYKVHEGGAAAVDEFPSRALMLCWPPKEQECSACEESGKDQDTESIFLALQVLCFLDEAAGSQLVQALEKYKGDTLIYVGEWTGRTGSLKSLSPHGETAGPKFQAKVLREWDLVSRTALPSWPFVHDELSVWRRKRLHALSPCQAPSSHRPCGPTGPISSSSDLSCEYRRRVIEIHRRLWEEDLIQYAKKNSTDEFSDAEKRIIQGLQGARDTQAALQVMLKEFVGWCDQNCPVGDVWSSRREGEHSGED